MTENFDKLYNKLIDKYGKKEVDKGYDVEHEHDDVVDKDEDYLKIVAAHEKELPKTYYKKLSKMEKKKDG